MLKRDSFWFINLACIFLKDIKNIARWRCKGQNSDAIKIFLERGALKMYDSCLHGLQKPANFILFTKLWWNFFWIHSNENNFHYHELEVGRVGKESNNRQSNPCFSSTKHWNTISQGDKQTSSWETTHWSNNNRSLQRPSCLVCMEQFSHAPQSLQINYISYPIKMYLTSTTCACPYHHPLEAIFEVGMVSDPIPLLVCVNSFNLLVIKGSMCQKGRGFISLCLHIMWLV